MPLPCLHAVTCTSIGSSNCSSAAIRVNPEVALGAEARSKDPLEVLRGKGLIVIIREHTVKGL